MSTTSRMALWLILAIDAMFFVGLLSASRVMNRSTGSLAVQLDVLAIFLLIAGRVALKSPHAAAVLALVASACLVRAAWHAPEIEQLLHTVLVTNVVALIVATVALKFESSVVWDVVIVLSCMTAASLF